MVRRHCDMARMERHEMFNGTGSAHMVQILGKEEMSGKGRLFNHVTLAPGCSIGLHQHKGDAEIFYILSGCGLAVDDGEEVRLEPGDMLYTGDGSSHSIRCDGEDPLEFLALILYT